VALSQGQYTEALSQTQEGLRLLRQRDEVYGLYYAFFLPSLGGVVAAQGQTGLAANLWGAAEAICLAKGVAIPPVFQHLVAPWQEKARTQLGEPAFQAALAKGRKWSLNQALEVAEQLPPPDEGAEPPSQAPSGSRAPSYPAGLTAREVEILRLVAQGLTDAQVAEQLVISPRTVNWHLTSIYSKLGVPSRSAATRFAIEHHLL
jgi:DNA-binding CsgD family transcriptional regulator